MALDLATGTAGNTISNTITSVIINPLIQQIDDAIHLDENRKNLETQLNRMKSLLLDIRNQFQEQQRTLPATVDNCVRRMENEVRTARGLIDRSRQQQHCLDCFLCKPNLSRQIREWKTNFEELFKEIQTDISVFYNTRGIVTSAPHQTELLLQDAPDYGFVGLEFKNAEKQLKSWLTEAPQVGLIGIWGMGGVGKTTLLKKVYNYYKVSDIFDVVIWVTVSQFSIIELQSCIAQTINLDLTVFHSNSDLRKMKLSAHLKIRKFLLILDDMWNPLNLKQLGVEFGNERGSKVVFSTRNGDLVRQMNTGKSFQLQPLSPDEAWELFRNVAFKDGHLPPDLEHIAEEVAKECKGLPLAINVIASTMIGIMAVDQWNLALGQMKIMDLNFPSTHPRVEYELYQILRWSYDRLPNANFKNCFLYCAMFPEDKEIEVDKLVGMWIAEGIVESKNPANLMETAKSYINLLVDRCLFEVAHFPQGIVFLKTHDVLRDMAIFIGEKEENCLFRAGQMHEQFPLEIREDCQRISLYDNNVTHLPAEGLKCRKLVSLILRGNKGLEKIPEAFLASFPCLKVLDLSRTKIKTLPISLWQLTQLEFLDLSYTEIEDVPEGIKNLYRLQFLDLSGCSKLSSLPRHIRELKNLKSLQASQYNVVL